MPRILTEEIIDAEKPISRALDELVLALAFNARFISNGVSTARTVYLGEWRANVRFPAVFIKTLDARDGGDSPYYGKELVTMRFRITCVVDTARGRQTETFAGEVGDAIASIVRNQPAVDDVWSEIGVSDVRIGQVPTGNEHAAAVQVDVYAERHM